MKRRAGAVGRPPSSYRRIMDAIFWVLRTGAQWSALPREFPPKSTVYDRFQYLVNEGFFTRLLENLGDELVKSGGISLDECFIDGTFVGAKKRGSETGKTKRGKGSKIVVIAEKSGLPVAVHVTSASPGEATLVEDTLDVRFTTEQPVILIGDRAYDSDPLDATLAHRGIKLVAPHRRNRVRKKTQDGRTLRRYKRRWRIERLNAWLQNFRRVLTRWDRKVESYKAFVLLACAAILSNST